jgi:hypothetical protein
MINNPELLHVTPLHRKSNILDHTKRIKENVNQLAGEKEKGMEITYPREDNPSKHTYHTTHANAQGYRRLAIYSFIISDKIKFYYHLIIRYGYE